MTTPELRALPADDLIALVARGDRHAFAELYDRYASRVLGLAHRLINNRAMAEEITQEVFLEVWQKATRFQPDLGSSASWILTVTRTRAIDRIRAEQSARERLLAAGIRDHEPAVEDVSDTVERTAETRSALVALRSLSEIQREAVSLYYSGYSHAELARKLDIPVGTAKTRVHDGLAKLRVQLRREGTGREMAFA